MFSDYTQFLDRHALRGARIAVPHLPYLTEPHGRSVEGHHRRDCRDASQGAFVADPYEIPNQAAIGAFGICISFPAPTNCSTVLMFGQKHDLNAYLTHRPNSPMHTQHDIVVYNTNHPEGTTRISSSRWISSTPIQAAPTRSGIRRISRRIFSSRAGTRRGVQRPRRHPGNRR